MPATVPQAPCATLITEQVRQALAEDVGDGDVTAALIPASAQAEAHVVCREPAVICGRPWFDAVFAQLDPTIALDWWVEEGTAVAADAVLCRLHGPARSMLTGERTALNFLQTLSGTATLTRHYVEAVRGTGVRILDTRKTLPGLRLAQKYAVRCGGGHNHRIGLYDALLLKENHILAAGSITAAVDAARRMAPGLLLEVEVEQLDELHEALMARVDRLLLDNMSPDMLREAVHLSAGRTELEASGGVNLASLRTVAATGVDYISSGSLTKHVQAIDLSMRFSQGASG